MECYIFQPGRIADQFIDALSDRARKGLNVTIVVDAIGSFNLWGRPVRRLREAGCRIESYQRLRWYSLARINNRTHRELLVVDGRIAFAGGAGIADWWAFPKRRRPPWRDTMARFEGPIVAALQGVAAENWLECCGEILTGPEYFPNLDPAGDTTAFVIRSSPSDRATASRVTFQLLMEGADQRRAHQHALFPAGPGAAARADGDRAARRRGRVIVPGRHTDQRWVRLASRRMWGELLAGRRQDLRVPGHHDACEGADHRRPVGGARHHQHRQPLVRAQRRDQRRPERRGGRRAAAGGLSSATCATARRSRWSAGSGGRCGRRSSGPFVWILERQQ